MGEVYRATDRLARQPVALKRVTAPRQQLRFSSSGAGMDVRVALANEFKLLASLRHPGVITVLDYGFDTAQQPYFTMDLLVNAHTLLEAAQTRSVPHKIVLLLQVLQALAYLHRRDIVHRDLKPDNVLVIGDHVKVMDFGLALETAIEHHEDKTAAGTLTYIAPEVLQFSLVSPASDLYSFGMMAYELFAGQHPYQHLPVHQLLYNIVYSMPNIESLDIASDIKNVLAKLLAKDPAHRYHDAESVLHDLAAAADIDIPLETVTIRESYLKAAKFVGRKTELATLKTALANAIAGKGSAWLVGGESGVGKSRLLEELRTEALVAGVTVLFGQSQQGGGVAYQLWRDVVSRLILQTELSTLEVGILKEVVPYIDELTGTSVLEVPVMSTTAAQQRLVETIIALFQRQTQPIVLLLEDLQWTRESLTPLTTLLPMIGSLPLLIVGSYRDDERPDLPQLLPGMTPIKLERLTPLEMSELSVSMLGEAGRNEEVLELLQRETEGNVFFLVETVRVLAENAGTLADIGRRTLPASVFAGGVQEIVRRRLGRISGTAFELLKYAAVYGRRLDAKVLETAVRLSGADTQFAPTQTATMPAVSVRPAKDVLAEHIQTWLGLAADAAVLEIVDGQWRFTHDKLREGVLAGVAADELPQLHECVAKAIEQLYPHDKTRLMMLVKHWRAAGNTHFELQYTHRAAQHALTINAYADAQNLLHRALTLLPENGAEQLQVELLNLMAMALDFPGDHDKARAIYEQALHLARASQFTSGIAVALNGVGLSMWRQGIYAGARAALEEALSYDENPQTMNNLGDIAWSQGDLEVAKQQYLRCIDLARTPDTLYVAAEAMQGVGTIAWRQGDFEAAKRYLGYSMDLHRDIGSRRGVASCYNSMGVIAAEEKKYTDACSYYGESIALYEQIGYQWGVGNASCNLAFVYLAMQAIDQALPALNRALWISYQLDHLPVLLEVLAGYAQLACLQGNYFRSAELVGLVSAHPATNEFTHNIRLRPLRDDLSNRLPLAELTEAYARGTRLIPTINEVVNGLLR